MVLPQHSGFRETTDAYFEKVYNGSMHPIIRIFLLLNRNLIPRETTLLRWSVLATKLERDGVVSGCEYPGKLKALRYTFPHRGCRRFSHSEAHIWLERPQNMNFH